MGSVVPSSCVKTDIFTRCLRAITQRNRNVSAYFQFIVQNSKGLISPRGLIAQDRVGRRGRWWGVSWNKEFNQETSTLVCTSVCSFPVAAITNYHKGHKQHLLFTRWPEPCHVVTLSWEIKVCGSELAHPASQRCLSHPMKLIPQWKQKAFKWKQITTSQSSTKNDGEKGEEREEEVEKHFLRESNFLIFDIICGASETISQ